MNAQINQPGRYGPWHLPKSWRAIEGQPGEVLAIERICGKYWCRLECGEWYAYHSHLGEGCMSGLVIGKGATRDHALLICREDMHAKSKETSML